MNNEVLKEGWLEKKGSFFYTWKIRWFVLTKESLDYYTTESKTVLKGKIQLSSNTHVKKKEVVGERIKFAIVTSSRTLEVLCEKEEYDGWVSTLEQIIDSYISCESVMNILPKEYTQLLDFSLAELRRLCNKLQIDHSSFSSKKQFTNALAKMYPNESFSLLRFRIFELEHDCYTENPSDDCIAEVNQLFTQLLQKLEVDDALFDVLDNSISLSQKVNYLRSSIW